MAPRPVERMVLDFVRHLHGRAGSLLINGDLFDFWFEWRHVIPRQSFRVLAALADLRESGVPILWIAGNHDCWGGEVLRSDVGVDYHVGAWSGTLGGWRSRIEHGDGLRSAEDRKYRALRSVLRHPLSVRAFRILHPDLGTRLASGSSEASRTHRPRDEGEGLRRVAHAQLAADPTLELLIFGHSHVPALERTERGGHGVYANAGSWLGEPTYLELVPERISLCRWTGSAEGERLHSLDRISQKALTES